MNALWVFAIYISMISTCAISADPTCEPSKLDTNVIICSSTEDYVLKRGLVSDNNRTQKIILRNCKITDIEFEAFRGLNFLKGIDLSKNKLTQIKLGVLDDATRVTHLNLSYNLITELPLGLFAKKTQLNVLNLQGNNIINLELGIFDPLTRLKHLDLASNALMGEAMDANIFRRNQQITYIDFSNNDMRDADENLLQGFQALEVLKLNRCSLSQVPLFATKSNLLTMTQLILTSNQISRINNKDIFINLESLEKLDLGWNGLKSLHADVFKPLINLKIINLRNNKLKSIPDTLFTNMRTLVNIDMSNNLITFIPVNAFRGTKVKNLNLASNRFTYLTDNFCLELSNSGAYLQKFYFHQNPWQCKCLLDILKEVNKFQIQYNGVQYDGKNPVCVSDDFNCKRHDNFNEIYVDMYNGLIPKS